jgi:hypothetical protein
MRFIGFYIECVCERYMTEARRMPPPEMQTPNCSGDTSLADRQ